jgi:hypothetical protein
MRAMFYFETKWLRHGYLDNDHQKKESKTTDQMFHVLFKNSLFFSTSFVILNKTTHQPKINVMFTNNPKTTSVSPPKVFLFPLKSLKKYSFTSPKCVVV